MKVVIDTNVLLVSAVSNSRTIEILDALIEGRIGLCVTVDIMLEYEEVFFRQGGLLAKELIAEILLNLPKIELVGVYYKWQLMNFDPDDNKFVDCAVAANADYIVTEDKHFDILNTIEFPKVNTIRSSDFIKILKST